MSDALRGLYDRQAGYYDRNRSRALFEEPWLIAVTADLRQGDAVMDLGCGAGAPVGVWLVDRGLAVTGVDFSSAMLALFRARLPTACAVEADMRQLALGRTFGAIVAWGSFFHLTRDEQRVALPLIAGHLAPGGRLLVTVGPGDGEAMGQVGGEPVYHASLDIAEYREILAGCGVTVDRFAPEDKATAGHSMLLARRET